MASIYDTKPCTCGRDIPVTAAECDLCPLERELEREGLIHGRAA